MSSLESTCSSQTCPEDVIHETALAAIDTYRPLYQVAGDAELALNVLRLRRHLTEQVRARYRSCPGAQLDGNGHLVCPLLGMIARSQAVAVMNGDPNLYTIQLEDVPPDSERLANDATIAGPYL